MVRVWLRLSSCLLHIEKGDKANYNSKNSISCMITDNSQNYILPSKCQRSDRSRFKGTNVT